VPFPFKEDLNHYLQALEEAKLHGVARSADNYPTQDVQVSSLSITGAGYVTRNC